MVSKTQEYDEAIVIEKLQEFCSKFRTRSEAADALGVGRVFLWRVLQGKAPPPEEMLKHIGFKRSRKITTYRYERA